MKTKVGEGKWVRRGIKAEDALVHWIIIGAPTPSGKRWLTVAEDCGGVAESYPEEIFHRMFYRIDEPDEN